MTSVRVIVNNEELTIDEALELYKQLKRLFGENEEIRVPTTYPQQPQPVNPVRLNAPIPVWCTTLTK